MALLEVENLQTHFRTPGGINRAVDGVSFHVNEGETLVRHRNLGRQEADAQTIEMLRRVRIPSPETRARDYPHQLSGGMRQRVMIAMALACNPKLLIADEPTTALDVTIQAQILDLMRALREELGIADPDQCLARYPHQLSGGMRQRVMIAIALSGNPQILIADEPTTALDVTIQAQILELLQRMQQRSGMSIIFITHNLGVVGEIADRAIVMYAGEVAESLPVASLFGGALMPYTMALLRSVPRLGNGGPGSKLAVIPGAPPTLTAPFAGCAFHPRCEHRMPGCEAEHPALDIVERDHTVRCHRWRELVEAAP